MSSKILVDELAGKTAAGNITVTSEGGSATMQLQQGLAKAWVNFNGTGTIAARDSYNLSSLTDLSTGQFTVNVANSFNNAGYSATASHSGNNIATSFDINGVAANSSSAIRYSTFEGNWIDRENNNVASHGDLA